MIRARFDMRSFIYAITCDATIYSRLWAAVRHNWRIRLTVSGQAAVLVVRNGEWYLLGKMTSDAQNKANELWSGCTAVTSVANRN